MAEAQVNRTGFSRESYNGEKSTLCIGCGHDSISRTVADAYFEMGVEPFRIGKMSGIGCSSKTPAYFISPGYGFNSTHGRMPSFATGAAMANRNMNLVGVSGDGDSMSIGLGQFLHMCRRNIDIVYIVENNGTYGLTKGQFSATSDLGSLSKKGAPNEFQPLDPCLLAIASGATFVGRSFSGDRKQLLPLLKAAIAHKGTAVLDIISPCVTFNNHEGSKKSFNFVREHNELLQEVGFIPAFSEIQVDYEPGTTKEVTLHDGSKVLLKKLGENELDVTSRAASCKLIAETLSRGELMTGLFFVDGKSKDFGEHTSLWETPLCHLDDKALRPSRDVFESICKEFQ